MGIHSGRPIGGGGLRGRNHTDVVPGEATDGEDVHFLDRDDRAVYGALVPRARARICLLGLLRQRGREVLTAKGYTKDDAANAMVSIFWHAATEVGTAPWFEHVPSATQLADGVSRGDRTLPERNGWTELNLQIDDLWELLLQILDEGGIAQWRHLRALQDITNTSVGGLEDDSGARGSRPAASARCQGVGGTPKLRQTSSPRRALCSHRSRRC